MFAFFFFSTARIQFVLVSDVCDNMYVIASLVCEARYSYYFQYIMLRRIAMAAESSLWLTSASPSMILPGEEEAGVEVEAEWIVVVLAVVDLVVAWGGLVASPGSRLLVLMTRQTFHPLSNQQLNPVANTLGFLRLSPSWCISLIFFFFFIFHKFRETIFPDIHVELSVRNLYKDWHDCHRNSATFLWHFAVCVRACVLDNM